MQNETHVTLTRDLELADIRTDGSFDCQCVVDVRCDENGNSRPVEEAVLKRLRNHFVDYIQLPMAAAAAGPCQQVHLCETVRDIRGKVMLVADDIASVASLLGIYGIQFKSRVFYVVETGKGDEFHPVNELPKSASTNVALVG